MTPTERKALAALARLKLGPAGRAELFRLIRARTDAEIEAALRPRASRPARAVDPFTDEIAQMLKPLLATAAEKAHYLCEELGVAAPPARGFAPAVRALTKAHGQAAVRAGAQRLMARIAKTHDPREPIP